MGVKGVVKKTRMLYMVDQTRVHVDSVEGLGDFMELEVSVIFCFIYAFRPIDLLACSPHLHC